MPDRPDATIRRFGRNSVALFVSDATGRILTAAFRIALAGYLGRELFGEYSFAVAVAAILSVCADLGLGTLVTREVARRPDAPFDIAGPALGGRLILTILAGGAALALLLLLERPRPVLELTAIFVLAQVALGPGEILAAAHRGRERMVRPAAVALITRFGLVLSGFAAMAMGLGVHAFAWLAAAWAVPAVLLLRPGLPGHVTLRLREMGPTLRRAFPIGIGAVLWTIYFRLDLVLLGFLRGDSEVGLYAAPFSLVEGVLLLQGPLLAASFPVFSSREADDEGRRRTFRALTRVLYVIGLPVAAVLFVERDAVLRLLFGTQFAEAGTTLALLALTIPVSFVAAPRLSLLIARNRERSYAGIMAGGVATNLVLDLLFIPGHGAAGAAAATLATEVLVTALTFVVLRERDVPGGETGRILRALGAAVILGTILTLAGTLGVTVAWRVAAVLPVAVSGWALLSRARSRRR